MSLRVVHTFGRRAGEVQTIAKDVVRFGRTPDNDVVFDPDFDRDASGHHAEVRKDGGDWVLVDLESRNGTFVHGARVSRHPLKPGDEVTFGPKGPRVRLEFVAEAPAGAAAARGSSPVLAKGSTTPMEVQPDRAAPAPKAQEHRGSAPALAPAPAPVAAPAPAAVPAPAPQRAPAAAPAPQRAPAAAPAPQRAPAAAPAPQHAHAASPAPQHAHAASPAARPAHAPLPAAEPAGKRVGQRTMAMMISSALAAARGRAPQHSTQEISAYVDKQVSAATRGQKRTTYLLGFLLLVALASLGGLIVWSSQSADEIQKLRSDLAKLPPNDPRRKDIEGRLGTLHPSNANFGRNLYDKSKKGIFMLAAGGEGFCTGFAVRPNILASNAHCVLAAKRHGGSIVALENEGRGQVSFSVTDMRAHPAYRDTDPNALTPDVGIFTIAGRAAVVLEVANAAELAGLGAGDDIYLIGFPGRLMDTSNPAATFLAAHIGRLTSPQGRLGAFSENWLLQHDASTTHGTSGSPIFNGTGKVIGVNAGGYLEGDDETIAGRKTEVVKASPYKFGMRIDLLDAVLR